MDLDPSQKVTMYGEFSPLVFEPAGVGDLVGRNRIHMDVHLAVSGPPSSRVVKELRIYGSRVLGPKMGPEFGQPPALRPSAVYDTDSARPEPTVGCSGARYTPRR